MTAVSPALWVFLSRMHQLAWKLEHGTHPPGSHGQPIIKTLIREELLDADFFEGRTPADTKRNMHEVLTAMVDKMLELNPNYQVSPIILRALNHAD